MVTNSTDAQQGIKRTVAAVSSGYPVLASSEWDPSHGAQRSRIHFQARKGASGWVAGFDDVNQWISVNLIEPKTVFAIETQGRGDNLDTDQFVKSYQVKYSLDGMSWIIVDNGRQFVANSDRDTIVRHNLETPVNARTIRICPTQWQVHPSMRFEVYFYDEQINSSRKILQTSTKSYSEQLSKIS